MIREVERRGPSGKLWLLGLSVEMTILGKCTIIPVFPVDGCSRGFRGLDLAFAAALMRVRVDTWHDVVVRVTVVRH